MTKFYKDTEGNETTIPFLPQTGASSTITTAAAGSAAATGLAPGVYRVISTVDIRLCDGATAAATDMLVKANAVESFYCGSGVIAAYDAGAGGGSVVLTLLP